MSESPTNASRLPRPIPTSKSPNQQTPNLGNLSRLSESSTGSWERGRMSGNARSPPEQSNAPSLASLSLNDPTSRPSLGLPRPPASDRSASSSGTTKLARPQREGYGFRPRSGQTTPAETESSHGPFSPVLNPVKNGFTSRREEEDEDEDLKYGYHQPDRISVGDLRQGVKEELSRQGGQEGSLVIQGPGIADAEGLGWPGQFYMYFSDVEHQLIEK